jgi:hypothetical protein
MKRPSVIWAACLAVPLLGSLPAAAAGSVYGPVSGFVMDARSHSIRPINGFPGSATLGTALSFPLPASLLAAAPGSDYALVTDLHGDGRALLARGLTSGAPVVAPLADSIVASQTRIAASGTAAVLYSQPEARLQFWSGLPAQPIAAAPVDASELSGGLAAMAVDAAGRVALLIAGDGGIYWAAANGTGLHFIVRLAGASSASILPDGQDAMVGNRETGDVVLIRNFTSSGAVTPLTGARDGIRSAVAVAALSNSEGGIVDGAGRLAAVSFDSGAVSWMPLAGTADRIDALSPGIFLLNQTQTGPLFLLDVTQGRTIYFVPAGNSDSSLQRGRETWKH